ncbi:MAG: benzoate-CoA ligase family protein [Gemmatimonadaceae bacterium]|nr:benzoate-CoA ligase family protein [Gemmatimonadaceae bacterium]
MNPRDRDARAWLPRAADMPEFRFDLPELQYPPRLNCVAELLDRWVEQGQGHRPCLSSPTLKWSYAETLDWVNRIANVLVGVLGMRPGDRVLLRAPNTPMFAAAYLAVMKAGGIAVATMPLLRAPELKVVMEKARTSLALCDNRLRAELDTAREGSEAFGRLVTFGTAETEMELLAAEAGAQFKAADTASDDLCLFSFTSGTTGGPKATMHYHRDVLAIADSYGKQVLRASPEDVFTGSPPLAFTFGLGGLVIFPMRIGASSLLLEKAPPDELLAAIRQHLPSVVFTAPTAYRAMLGKLRPGDLDSLRICVSAGETLPASTFDAWKKATGITLMDGIGATEMLHIFIGSPADEAKAGSTGRVVPGYEARIVDDSGNDVPDGTPGHLAVRGPTGCRYLDDPRQRRYVKQGWNYPGDTYIRDADGYFWYQARSDDMIVSSGYNIAGPEVEQALLAHAAVAECGVVGLPDAERGTVVAAFVVLKPGHSGDAALVSALQEHVKATIAPYKYPRSVRFVEALPKTSSGKLRRNVLRETGTA